MSVSTMSALSLGSPSDSLATLGTDHWAIEAEQGEQSRKTMNKFLICESFLIIDVSYDSIYATPTRIIPLSKKKKRIR